MKRRRRTQDPTLAEVVHELTGLGQRGREDLLVEGGVPLLAAGEEQLVTHR